MKIRALGTILAIVGLIGLLLILSVRIGKPCLESIIPMRVTVCYGGITPDGNEPVTTLDINVMEQSFVFYTVLFAMLFGIGMGLVLADYLPKYQVVEKRRRVQIH